MWYNIGSGGRGSYLCPYLRTSFTLSEKRTIKMNKYQWVDRVMEDPNLKPTTKVVAYAIASFANGDNFCWPNREQIAKRVGILPKNVSRYTSELEQHGYLQLGFKQRSRNYTLINTPQIDVRHIDEGDIEEPQIEYEEPQIEARGTSDRRPNTFTNTSINTSTNDQDLEEEYPSEPEEESLRELLHSEELIPTRKLAGISQRDIEPENNIPLDSLDSTSLDSVTPAHKFAGSDRFSSGSIILDSVNKIGLESTKSDDNTSSDSLNPNTLINIESNDRFSSDSNNPNTVNNIESNTRDDVSSGSIDETDFIQTNSIQELLSKSPFFNCTTVSSPKKPYSAPRKRFKAPVSVSEHCQGRSVGLAS